MSDHIYLLSTLPLTAEQVDSLQALSTRLEIHVVNAQQDETVSEEVWEQTEILYTYQALPLVGEAPNLRWIQFYLSGVDEHLDNELLHQPGLRVTTLSGANAPQVAEHALTLLLALGHKLPAMFADQASSKWAARRLERFQPTELQGSTVGIVGYGSVGRHLAGLLQSFNCTVLASKRDLMQLEDLGYRAKGQGDPEASLARRLYPSKALGSMLKDCDFVVLCVPLNSETRGLIGSKQFQAMKSTAYFVDVSRGGVADHEALIEALNKGQIAGAALDVFPEEPLPADDPLWEMPNVLVSPHVAGLSPHYDQRAFELLKENLTRYLEERELLNVIDLARGY